MARDNTLDDNNSVKQTIEKVRLTFMEALKRNLEKGALYAGAMFLGTLMLYNSGVYAEAAVPVDTSVSIEQTASMDTLDNVTDSITANTATETSTSKLARAVQFKATINRDTTSRTVKASKKAVKAARLKKANNTKIKNSLTKSVTVNGTKITLGMSKQSVENMMNAIYSAPAYSGKGCQSYDTDCLYYQQNGNQTSFMFEFYNGTLERVLFSSPKWSIGNFNNGTKASSIPLSGKSYKTADGSVTAKQYSVSKGKVSFTAHLDNAKEWKNAGWYLCELKDTGVTHSGRNSLADQTKELSFDLSMFDTNSTFQKKYKKITKNKVIAACSKVNLLDLEKGKQNVYLTNMYRAYHGLELAAYSEHSSEYAYVNAKVRSMAKEDFHADFFEGEFAHQALQKTINTERVNEWWGGWQETFSENAGYESGADAITVLRGTVASTGHLENVLSGNFAMGAAIVDGYDTVETIGAALMDADEIAEAQQRFVEEFDLGIAANEVEAALYRDLWDSFTYNDLYELSYMSKEEWINFILDKYELQDVKGAKVYIGMQYDHYCNNERCYIYYGKDGFFDVNQYRLDQGTITASQLEEVYLHFCALEYDQEYTQALMSHFGCTAEQVYLEHSDIVVELAKTPGRELEYKVKEISDKYKMPLKSTIEMIVKAHTSYNAEGVAEALDYLYNYFGIN